MPALLNIDIFVGNSGVAENPDGIVFDWLDNNGIALDLTGYEFIFRVISGVASTGAIQSSNNVSSCVCAQTGIYMYTFSTPLPDTEYVVNVMTSNELAERGSEVIITSNNTMNVYIFTSGATRANLAHSFEIWR